MQNKTILIKLAYVDFGTNKLKFQREITKRENVKLKRPRDIIGNYKPQSVSGYSNEKHKATKVRGWRAEEDLSHLLFAKKRWRDWCGTYTENGELWPKFAWTGNSNTVNVISVLWTENTDYSRCYRNHSVSHLSYVRWKGPWFISTVRLWYRFQMPRVYKSKKYANVHSYTTERDLLIWPQSLSPYVPILKSNKKINEKYS